MIIKSSQNPQWSFSLEINNYTKLQRHTYNLLARHKNILYL